MWKQRAVGRLHADAGRGRLRFTPPAIAINKMFDKKLGCARSIYGITLVRAHTTSLRPPWYEFMVLSLPKVNPRITHTHQLHSRSVYMCVCVHVMCIWTHASCYRTSLFYLQIFPVRSVCVWKKAIGEFPRALSRESMIYWNRGLFVHDFIKSKEPFFIDVNWLYMRPGNDSQKVPQRCVCFCLSIFIYFSCYIFILFTFMRADCFSFSCKNVKFQPPRFHSSMPI
jgi:hypothetical protein